MDLLTAVRTRARVEGDLVLVDDFLNHRVDPEIMTEIGRDLAERFAFPSADVILTAEASGIPPALSCARELGVPMIYAKKFLGVGNRYAFAREVSSPTKGVEYRVEVARRVLEPGQQVVVIDDFLSGGRTAEALGEITEEAGCELLGLGFVVEKRFMAGRDRLERHGWRVESLVAIDSLDDASIVFAD